MADLAEVYAQIRAEVTHEMAHFMHDTIPVYQTMSLEEIQQRLTKAHEDFGRDLTGAKPIHYGQFWRSTSYVRATQGRNIESVINVLRLDYTFITQAFKRHFANDLAAQIEALERTHAICETGVGAIYDGFAQLQGEVIDQQVSTLQELSTPIVPIYEGVLVLPMIGNIDSNRASRIMEDLLEQISVNNADVVILDITGVPLIDTGVANYILQTARAVRLLGSQVVLVGIGADIAQTIVQLGIDLNMITTRANLRAGFEYALNQLGFGITQLEAA
jgi:rsbT co-antagonist protein RsbR